MTLLAAEETLGDLRFSDNKVSFSEFEIILVASESTVFMDAEEDNTGGVSLESGRGSLDGIMRRGDVAEVTRDIFERALRATDFTEAAEFLTVSFPCFVTLCFKVSVRNDCMLTVSESSLFTGRKVPLTPLGATEGVIGLNKSSSLTSISVRQG